MHGGSKFTVVGHDKDPISESDVYTLDPDDDDKKISFLQHMTKN